MQTITLRSHVGTDGVLHLEIPSDYKDSELDVTVTVRPAEALFSNDCKAASWPPAFFENVIGGWKGEPLVRDDIRSYEVREEL